MKKFAVIFMLMASQAYAVEYKQVQADQSNIAFEYKQMGVAMDGKFKKFTSQLSFDPEQATKAKAAFDVELASIDTGSAEADEEVAGKLTIKSKTQDVLFPVTFTQQGKNGVLAGGFTIHRGDFSIGEGAWAKFDVVANDIVIKFRMTAATGK